MNKNINYRITLKASKTAASQLTHREREVALLARDRLSTKEIAERLFITEGTVKGTLKASTESWRYSPRRN